VFVVLPEWPIETSSGMDGLPDEDEKEIAEWRLAPELIYPS